MPLIKVYPDPNMPKLFTIDWMLHDRCTYDCSYCPPANKSGTDSWLDLTTLNEFCTELETHVNTVNAGAKIHAMFTGGEPTVWKDFSNLVDRLSERGWLLSVNSNGSRTARWWEENAKKFAKIHLSYHTEFVNDEELLEKLSICQSHARTTINIMLNPRPDLFERAINFSKILKQYPRIHVQFSPIQYNFGMQDINVPAYTKEQTQIISNLKDQPIIDFTPYKKDFVRSFLAETEDHGIINFMPSELLRSKDVNFLNWNCHIGLESIFIDARGDIIRGTCRAGDKLGNIMFPRNITWPTAPIKCPYTWCGCITDLLNTKTH